MTCTDTDRVAWALLSRAASGPCAPLAELVRCVGAIEAAALVQAGQAPAAIPAPVVARAGGFEAAARDLDRVQRLGGRLVTPDDEEWPRELLACLPTGSDNPGDVCAAESNAPNRGNPR